jgi:hypothetical protein
MPEKGRTEDLGVWAMFPASAQCAGPSVEPQTGLPHLLRIGTELADQTSETVKAGQTRSAGSAGRTERDLVDHCLATHAKHV